MTRSADQVLFSLPEGRERSRRPSLSGCRLLFVVVGHCSHLETSFRFSEPSAVRLDSGPLNILRLARFLEHTLFPLSRGTLWSGRPLLWSYATFDARRLVFGAPGRASCLPNPRLASVFVCLGYKPYFPCLGSSTRVGDQLSPWKPLFSPPANFLVGKLVFLVFGPHFLVFHPTIGFLSV